MAGSFQKRHSEQKQANRIEQEKIRREI